MSAAAEKCGCEFLETISESEPEALEAVSANVTSHYHILPLRVSEDKLILVTTDSFNADLNPYTKRPVDIELTYSQHCCPTCGSHFNAKIEDLASPKSRYTRCVVDLAVRLIPEDGLPYCAALWHLWRDHRVFVPWGTIQNWVEAARKKTESIISSDYLDEVLADFSGYIAADEAYDGPFCIPFIVDNLQCR